jgi:hypothetical protein
VSGDSIVRAARETLLADGYRGFSVEAVAARAGVEPGSMGRGDVDLLVDVLADGLTVPSVADVGNSEIELRAVIHALSDRYANQQRFQAALLGLTADRVDDSEASRLLVEWCTVRGRANLAVVLRRAVDRGDLPPDTDLDLLHDIVMGSVSYRQEAGRRDDNPAFAHQIANMLLRGTVPLRDPLASIGGPAEKDPSWLEEDNRPSGLNKVIWWFEAFGFGSLRPLADAPAAELAAVPSLVKVGRCAITIRAHLARDFMPSIGPDESGLRVGVMFRAAGKGELPPFLHADRVAVVHTDEVWVAPLGERTTRTSRYFEAGTGQGPKWEPGTRVDVVVHLKGANGERYPVRAAECVIESVS